MAEEEQMKQTSNANAQRPTSNGRNIQHWALSVQRWTLGVFSGEFSTSSSPAFSFTLGALKVIDPRSQFASDIDNFKILPWPVSVALAFYLPWLEIFCALGLVFRFLYRGALSILSASIVVFTLATIAAKLRGLDITCGCFGHASQHWSFPCSPRNQPRNSRHPAFAFSPFKATSGNRLPNAV